jgi:hypothetical protein
MDLAGDAPIGSIASLEQLAETVIYISPSKGYSSQELILVGDHDLPNGAQCNRAGPGQAAAAASRHAVLRSRKLHGLQHARCTVCNTFYGLQHVARFARDTLHPRPAIAGQLCSCRLGRQ